MLQGRMMKATEWSQCLKGNPTNITHQSVFTGPGENFCMCEKVKKYKARLCGSKGSCMETDELPPVTSLSH